jgi:transposase
LRDWAHLSLDARCELLKSKYNIQISRFTLGKYYRELKISYLKTHSSFYSSRTEEEMV